MPGKLEFTIGSTPLTSEEVRLFQADLKQLGLDAGAISLLNQMPEISSTYSKPKIIRSYIDGELCGVAWIIECRRSFQPILPGWFGKFMDMPGIPIFFWGRCDIGIDSINNPGFVTRGVSRSEFFEQCLNFLTRRYLNGLVVSKSHDLQLPWALSFPFVDSGYIDIREDTPETYLLRHQHLRRKRNKFHNKGGEIEIYEGGIPADIAPALSQCLADAETNARTKLAFQEIYNPLAMHNLRHADLATVHVVARLNGEIIGYQSFLHSGKALHCLSGGFNRSGRTTYHAYENIILESIRYARDKSIERINYGPIFNPTKAAMMEYFETVHIHFYTRHAWMRMGIPAIIRRSALSADRLAAFSNLQSKPPVKVAG